MKRALSLLLITCLLLLGIEGMVAAVPPSGPGQTTAAHSMSIVFASDATLPTVTVSGGATAAHQVTQNGYLDGLETLIGTTNSSLTTIDGRVDGLETLVTSTNTKLDTIDGRVDGLEALVTSTNGYVDGLETLVTSTNTKLDTIDGRVDGIETLIGTTNSSLTTIDGRVDGLEALVTSTNGYVDGIETLVTATNASLELLKQPTRTAAVTISDSTDVTSTCTKGVWVGTGGNLAVKGAGDSAAVTHKNVPSGTYVPGALSRVMSTNTTAADINCLYGP